MDLTATTLHLTQAIPVRAEPRSITTSVSFEAALETAQRPRHRAHVVQQGETLWSICRAYLRRSGRAAHDAAVAEEVRRVARHNGITDPDFILPGQVFELPALEPARQVGRAEGGAAGNRTHASTADRVQQGGPAAASNPRTEALWRARKAALQAKGAFAGLFREEFESGQAPDVTQHPFGRLIGGPAWVSSEFGTRRDPFTGRVQQHNGIDLAAPKGTEVYAFQHGRVVFSGWRGSYGRLIVVEHEDGSETRYGHLADRHVKAGDVVTPDTVLGTVGSSGRSTGPHLHFELHRNARPVDPLPHLRPRLAQSK